MGERSTYDAASQCSRCGYCEQACPTYVATGQESKSGRGRNQLVRLMLEGKLKDPSEAEEALATCLLCGACTTACYAHVPTADIVLEGRRMLRGKSPWLAKLLTMLLRHAPALLAVLLKLSYLMKRAGLSALAFPALRILGFKGLAEADAHVEEVPLIFLYEELRQRPAVDNPAWLYFAACGSNYLYPRVGLATVKVLESALGSGRFMDNSCCGLLSYNYGDIADARALAQKNIAQSETTQPPLVGDCSSCVAFLKNYPQLFLDDQEWKQRAEKFSRRVRDAVEIISKADITGKQPEAVVTYHESCRACHGQGLRSPKEALSRACGGAWRPLPEADVCCGGAGAFSFVHPELSDEVLRRKIGAIASTQARLVLTSSTSCLIQLAHGLKKYYPECRVLHISEFMANILAENGTKTRA